MQINEEFFVFLQPKHRFTIEKRWEAEEALGMSLNRIKKQIDEYFCDRDKAYPIRLS
jgi:hypothetical protein